MSFSDIIKKSVLNKFSDSTFSLKEIAVLLALALAIGIFIFFVYRLVCKNGFYSKAFNVSLILMPIITATIIIAVQTSVVVSLGMVGALSIVRFRTALKNPLDLIFMFWSISVGIVVGADLPVLAGIMSLIVAIVLMVINILPSGSRAKLLNICIDGEESEIKKIVNKYAPKADVKSKSFNGTYTNLLFEISVKDTDELFDELKKCQSVKSISIVKQEEQQF